MLTGQLGDVMRESAQAASPTSVPRRELGIRRIPSTSPISTSTARGAMPKDGPSAGITMATALISALTGRRSSDVAMTGEITLRGRVLPIGGLKEKVLAAHRAGFKHRDLAEAQRERPERRAAVGAARAAISCSRATCREVLRAALGTVAPDGRGADDRCRDGGR